VASVVRVRRLYTRGCPRFDIIVSSQTNISRISMIARLDTLRQGKSRIGWVAAPLVRARTSAYMGWTTPTTPTSPTVTCASRGTTGGLLASVHDLSFGSGQTVSPGQGTRTPDILLRMMSVSVRVTDTSGRINVREPDIFLCPDVRARK